MTRSLETNPSRLRIKAPIMDKTRTAKMKANDRESVAFRDGDALLVIDCINDLQFPGGEQVLPWAQKLASRLAGFRAQAHRSGMPVIYVNDNFGQWRSSFADVFTYCTRRSARGRDLCRRLKPSRNDYFVLKPRHSAFFATSLIPLLEHLNIQRLLLAGIATNLCVLFTAHDAHMHQYPMIVLSDCCAAESDFDHDTALRQLERFCDATICLSTEFHFKTRRTTNEKGRR
jgi:nicotinamidase-related amidase